MTSHPWKARVSVTFLAKNRTTTLLTECVGARSIFVRTDAPPSWMTLVRVQVSLPPHGAEFVVHGTVTNVIKPGADGSVSGAEIGFFAMSGEAMAAWDGFLAFLRDAHPESSRRPVTFVRDASQDGAPPSLVDAVRADEVTPTSMFLRTRDMLAVGSDVKVTLSNPASWATVSLDCVVRRRVRGGDADGVGLEFRNMSHASWDELASFLRDADGRAKAEVSTVRAESAPMAMATLPGPWTKDPKAIVSRFTGVSGAWSVPPSGEWSLPPAAGDV